MRFLLDTNAWLRLFLFPSELAPSLRQKLSTEPMLGLSAMSVIEVAQKVAKGKLNCGVPVRDWTQLATPPSLIRVIPLNAEIALRAYEWPADFHGDPADRIIAATAIVHRLTLVTSDEKLLGRPDLPTLDTR